MSFARAATTSALSLTLSLQGIAVANAAPEPGGEDATEIRAPESGDGVTSPQRPQPGEATSRKAAAPADDSEPSSLQDALLQEALDRYIEGGQLFESKRYLKAAVAYERSYAAVPVGKTLYNVGLSYELGADIVRALDAYARYAELPDCPAPQEQCADKRVEVQATIRRLKALVGVLTIVLDDGVDLRGIDIDGRTVQLDDFPLILDPGRYELRIRGRKRGQVQIRQVDIEAGQRASLVIPGFDQPAPVVVPPSSSGNPDPVVPPRVTPDERRRRLKLAFYGGIGLTGLSAIAMSITGVVALGAFRRQDQRCKGEDIVCSGTTYPEADRNRVDALVPVTNAFVGLTAGLGLTTVVVGLFAFSKSGGKSNTKRPARAGRSGARLQASPTGLRIRF